MRCPHGFTSTTISFDGACHDETCLLAADSTLSVACMAHPDYAYRSDPIRWPREVRLPLGDIHGTVLPHLLSLVPPKLVAIAMHENTGSFREAWAPFAHAASLADRPTSTPPSPSTLHFIAGDEAFHAWYPHPLLFITSHWDCAPATYAASFMFGKNMETGILQRNVDHAVWCRSISPLYAAEQTRTALECIIGPPTVKLNLSSFVGTRDKAWWWWQSEGLPVCKPPNGVDSSAARSEHHDSDHLPIELKKLARAGTPPLFARMHVEAWAAFVLSAAASSTRLPRALSDQYDRDLLSARACLTMWACSYPGVSRRLDHGSVAVSRCIIVPVHMDGELLALVPSSGYMGDPCSAADVAACSERLAMRFGCVGTPDLSNCFQNELGGYDYVFAAAARAPPSAAGSLELDDVAWLTYDELFNVDSVRYAAFCLHRQAQHVTTTADAPVTIGALGPPVPLVSSAEAHAWAAAPDDPRASAEWAAFLRRDAAAAERLALAMRALDDGDGRMRTWALQVTSAATLAHELPVPPQGVVRLDPSLRWAVFPEYFIPDPLPYISQFLVSLPPQQLPPGYDIHTVRDILQPWGRRRILTHSRTQGARDIWCVLNAPDQNMFALTDEEETAWLRNAPPAPDDLALGEGAFMSVTHADGIGSWRTCEVIHTVHADERVEPFDWTRGFRTLFSEEDLKAMLNVRTDLELLSHVFEGCRFKACPHRRLQIGANLRSLASRAIPIAADLGKLAAEGRYVVRPLWWADEQEPTSAWPTLFIPTCSSPVGGVDKKGKPLSKRRISHGSWPDVEMRVRNCDEGEPDGQLFGSQNAEIGPMRPLLGQQPRLEPYEVTAYGSLCDCCMLVVVRHSADGAHVWWGMLFCRPCLSGEAWHHLEPLKWHKECKHRIPHVYAAAGVLRAVCDIDGDDVYAIEDDWNWMFWQFKTHPSDWPLATLLAVVKLGTRFAFSEVGERVGNMGRSAMSNICSHTSIRHLQSWETEMDVVAKPIVAAMSQQVRDVVAQREHRLGHPHGRLFWAGVFTDNVIILCKGAQLAAAAASLWDRRATDVGIRMSDLDERGAGTVPIHIGARFVLNAGFGCLPPPKRVRALAGLREAIDGTIGERPCMLAKPFESHCGLLGHVVDTLHIDRSLLHGIKRPMEHAFFEDSPISLTVDGLARHLELETHISMRGAASFACGISDAALAATLGVPIQVRPRSVRIGSDACTDATHPAVFGMAEGIYYVFPLTGDWLRVAITVTESLGGGLDLLVLAPLFPLCRVENETDASTTHAMLQGRAHSRTQQSIYARLRADPRFQEVARRASSTHIKGVANVMRDCGSRGYIRMLRAWAAALGIQLRQVELSQPDLDFAAGVLADALSIGEAILREPEVGTMGQAPDGDVEAPLWQSPAPGRPPAFAPLATYGGEDMEVIRFMPLRAASPRHSPVRAASPSLARPSQALLHREQSSPGSRAPMGLQSPMAPHRAALREGDCVATPSARPAGYSPGNPQPVRLQEAVRSPPLLSHRPRLPLSPTIQTSRANPPRHPKPRTAAALRALGTQRLTAKLAADTSEWALCPGDSHILSAMVGEIAQARAEAVPISTSSANDNGVRWLGIVSDVLNTTPLRPPAEHAFEEREVFFWAYLIFHHACHASPAERTATTQSGVKRTRVKPSSSLNVAYGARRALEEYGSWLPPMRGVLKILRGLNLRMIADFGDDALARVQARPWSLAELARLMAVLLRGSQHLAWSTSKREMVRWHLTFSLGVGNRLAELTRYMLANIKWYDASLRELSPELAETDVFTTGCYAKLRPVTSKTDATGDVWVASDMWFRVDTSDPWSLGAAMLERERAYCTVADRRSTPLFFNPDVGSCVKYRDAQHRQNLKELVGATFSEGDDVSDVWHSARVTLACQLRKLDKGWDVIQCHLRHKNPESARIYGRLEAVGYADTAAQASKADGSGVLPRDLPPIDPVEEKQSLDDAIAALEGDISEARERTSAAAAELPAEAAATTAPAKATKATPAKQARGTAQTVAPERRKRAVPPTPPTTALVVVEQGGDREVRAALHDSWGLVGRDVCVPHAAWPGEEQDPAASMCTVVGFASGPPRFFMRLGEHDYSFRLPALRSILTLRANRELMASIGGRQTIAAPPKAALNPPAPGADSTPHSRSARHKMCRPQQAC